MHWLDLIGWFAGGAVLMNAVPHLVAGVLGRPFQTPFADPPGQGLSSSKVNFCWGFANGCMGYLLIGHIGSFELANSVDAAIVGLGMLTMGVFAAHHFGRLHGGDLSIKP